MPSRRALLTALSLIILARPGYAQLRASGTGSLEVDDHDVRHGRIFTTLHPASTRWAPVVALQLEALVYGGENFQERKILGAVPAAGFRGPVAGGTLQLLAGYALLVADDVDNALPRAPVLITSETVEHGVVNAARFDYAGPWQVSLATAVNYRAETFWGRASLERVLFGGSAAALLVGGEGAYVTHDGDHAAQFGGSLRWRMGVAGLRVSAGRKLASETLPDASYARFELSLQ